MRWILAGVLFFCLNVSFAQDSSLEQKLLTAEGSERLTILLSLTDRYKISKPKQGTKYAMEAIDLAYSLKQYPELAKGYYLLAIINRDSKKYRRAITDAEAGLIIANARNLPRQRIEGYKILETIYNLQGRRSKAGEYVGIYTAIQDSLDEIAMQNRLAQLQEDFAEEQAELAVIEEERAKVTAELQQEKVLSQQKGEEIVALQRTATELENERMKLQIQAQDLERQNLLNELKLSEEQARREKDRNQRNVFMALFIVSGLILLGIYLSFRMFRHKRQARQEMERRKKLEQVDRLKDQFIANTSHELRTPLHGMIGLAESLRDGTAGTVNPEMEKNLSMIVHSGNRLSALINDLLDFSKLKSNQLELEPRPIDLKVITDVVIQGISPLIEQKELNIINSIPSSLPAISADENRIQQILFNLIGNAIKFTEKGTVTIQASETDDGVQVDIIDTGIGISKNKLKTIFDVFIQGDGSTERAHSGTGLGLTITKQLVELHGGVISVESMEGEGSTFTFTLPKAGEEPEMILDSAAYPEPSLSKLLDLETIKETLNMDFTVPVVEEDEVTGYNILLVDDEPVNQQVLINHLKNEGCEITSAMNGEEALAALDKKKFDLVLLDLMMPRMSGYEVCKYIREKYLPSELPIIMVTAKNQVQDMVQGLRLGANDYLAKPFSKDEFLARVKTQINLHQISKATSKFVPYEFLKSIGREHITDVQLGDQTEKEVTVVFSDIRDYTTLSEAMTPEENFQFVNAYAGRMGPIIRVHNGFVNQYLGDAIMSIFLNSPEDALRASVEMLKVVQTYNVERTNKGRKPIRIGVGLHTGSLIMGIIGDQSRTDAATVSDTVNTASRMEGLTKYYGVNLLVSEYSLQRIPNPELFHFRYLGPVQVKGKKEPVGVYECIDGDPVKDFNKKIETLEDFNAAVDLFFRKDFDGAEKLFLQILAVHPEDQACKYYLQKAQNYSNAGIHDNWTGVEQMSTK